jgi:hypothetical protein
VPPLMPRFPKISLAVIGWAMLETSARGDQLAHGTTLENRDIRMYGAGYAARSTSPQIDLPDSVIDSPLRRGVLWRRKLKVTKARLAPTRERLRRESSRATRQTRGGEPCSVS